MSHTRQESDLVRTILKDIQVRSRDLNINLKEEFLTRSKDGLVTEA